MGSVLIFVIPANGHDPMVTTKHESQLSAPSVIPACFWRESKKTSWIPASAGMTKRTFIQKQESSNHGTFWIPACAGMTVG
jgi:hypothetical protein